MKSPLPWPGGKSYLLKTLVRFMPQHRIYVEVFSGSAKLLFAKRESKYEILNDVNDELLNFYRVVKHRPSELADLFERDFRGRARFMELCGESRFKSRRDCELIRAHRFAYLVWWSFGAKSTSFIRPRRGKLNRPILALRSLLEQTSIRLSNVVIDKTDFADCIRRYDSRDTFFYLDPPYVNAGDLGHYKPMQEERNEELIEILANIRGKFLLSYDNAPLIRRLAAEKNFTIRKVSVRYTINEKSNDMRVTELLISNYELPRIRSAPRSDPSTSLQTSADLV
jgi:DNA adenine methylase